MMDKSSFFTSYKVSVTKFAMKDFVYNEIFENEDSYWWFVGTRNIIFDQIDTYLNKVNQLEILDIGCGTGTVIKRLKKYGNVTGTDISSRALSLCKKRGINNVLKADAAKLPFDKNAFNLVTILDVLEHTKSDNLAISEIHRVLKKDGIAIITVPAFSFLWSNHDYVLHHLRRYSIGDIKNKITKHGFKILKISYFNFLFFLIVYFYRLFKKLLYKVNHKRPSTTDIIKIPNILNNFLISILNLESIMLKKINLPFGVSILAIVKK